MGWTPAQVSSVIDRDPYARKLLREATDAAGHIEGSLEAQLLTRARYFVQVVAGNLDLFEQRLADAED
jgi:hypothetical protein